MPPPKDHSDPLARALLEFTDAVNRQTEFFRANLSAATKHDLEKAKEQIMSAISDFAAKQNAFNARQAEAQTALTEAISDVTGDIKTLNDKITELQNSPGGVTPEDQALLDSLTEQGETLVTKAEALSAALKALAALTPPKPPTG